MLWIGSHVSMKAPRYLEGSVDEALSYGANALMVYTGAPQNSKRVETEKLHIKEARQKLQEHDIPMACLVVHAPYIINLGNSVNAETANFGVDFLKEELRRVDAIGARYLVLHPGAHMKAGLEAGIQWIVNGLNAVLDEDESDIQILLETMAGKGTECGWQFEQLARIREQVHKSERIGICLDTCHIHDAGYDIHDVDGWLRELDMTIGIEHLKVMHINDSKNARGARKDRHENLGKGEIGFETLARIVHHPRLENVIKILETPYIEKKPPYKEEIEQLRSWQDETVPY